MNDFANRAVSSSKDFMGIAPVRYPAALNLAPLQGSDQSFVNLRSYFRSADNLTVSSASKNNFLDQYDQIQIIQLYTHSSDSSGKGEPVIYFADSALYLSELFNDKKPATRLIVLSACKTGMSKLYKGEGVFSCNRGFAALGIPAAVTNLWAVDKYNYVFAYRAFL
jgi:CHAT domain-containing protein